MRYGWSLEPQSWKNLSNTVSTLSWRCVPFERIHSSAVSPESGVYLICGATPVIKTAPFNQFLNVLYAGLSTTSIRSRFIQHCSDPDQGIRNGKQCYGFVATQMRFYFAPAPSTSVADIERLLIHCFGPPCNRQSGIITAKLGEERPAG